jgi:hypothetical protein
MRQLKLYQGSSPRVPSGWHLVETEVEFFKLALCEEPLFIAGAAYAWAKRFYEARAIRFEVIRRAEEELAELIPRLTPEIATALLGRLGGTFDGFSRPLQLEDLADGLWPEGFWRDPLTAGHAANWAMWWLESHPDPAEQALLQALAKHYKANSAVREASAYELGDAEAAFAFLRRWLEQPPEGWEAFPVVLAPALQRRLREAYRALAVQEKGGLFVRLQRLGADRSALRLAAEASAGYFAEHPDEFGTQDLRSLKPFVSPELHRRLEAILPAPSPRPLPEKTEDWHCWFTEEYLPFRSKRPADDAEVSRIARDFAPIYLERYAAALMASGDRQHLSFAKTQTLADPGVLSLLVVLDGLSYLDICALWRNLEQEDAAQRLTLGRASLAFAPVPSITEVAKRALVTGSRPDDAVGRPPIGSEYSKDDEARAALQSAPDGAVVVWSILDTDSVYHRAQSGRVGDRNAEGVLLSVAKRMLDLVVSVPETRHLQIVITTDHGRILSSSERTVRAPEGMRPHGRAALGAANRAFPEGGVIVEGDLALLSAARFGLIEDAAVLLTDASFLTSDGRGGNEYQPHGGLYPEEVLIPYWVLQRDARLALPIAVLEGAAQAGKAGTLRLSVDNPNTLMLRLVALELQFGANVVRELQRDVEPMSSLTLEIPFGPWPTQAQLENASAKLVFRTPSGVERQAAVCLNLASKEMYVQPDILKDLL